MSKTITATALAAVLAMSTAIPAAHADRRGDGFRGHHGHGHHHHHRGHGRWVNGKWVALGILGAAAVDALDDDDCYRTRRGRIVCR